MTTPLSVLLAEHARSATIPDDARERAHIILMDALIAILSGRDLHAGNAAKRYVRRPQQGGPTEAREFATLSRTSAGDAAFINGILAHADETDDSHESARMHPSCSIVPAALAAGEAAGADLARILDAIAVGYDVGVALNLATWTDPRVLRASRISTHHTGGLFGSVGATLRAREVETQVGATAFSYAVQHAGGSTTWLRDTEHVEKAVVFGGLPARSALFSVELASLGFSGVVDPFGGSENFFDAFGVDSDAQVAVQRLTTPGLGVREACIKRYPVGMPIQAVAQALDEILGLGVTAHPDHILVELPQEKVHVVSHREMADISAQHVIALRLVAGDIRFDVLHELAPVPDGVEALKQRVELIGVRELDADSNGHGTTRVARVTLTSGDDKRMGFVAWPTGTPENPIGWTEVEHKASEVLTGSGWGPPAALEFCRVMRNADAHAPIAVLLDSVAELIP